MEHIMYPPCGGKSEFISERRWYLNNLERTMSFGGKFPRRVVQSKMSGLKPDLISNFPGEKVTGCSGSHKFSGGVMGSKGFFLGLVELG